MFPITEFSVGPDKVHLIGDTVVIFAMRAMPEWTVREFSRSPIYFQDGKYFLRRKTAGPAPFAFQYELAPWHSGLGAESNLSITYDEAYVARREEQHRGDRRENLIYPALVCIYPLLGFLWSGFKERVLGPLGFEPAAITAASTLFEFCFFMLEGVFILYFHGGLIAPFCGRAAFDSMLWVDRALFIIVPLDAMLRYDQVLRGNASPDGFLEWVFRRLRKSR
jgi:hypothetical protein